MSILSGENPFEEKKKGLWANIHAKRKRGEKPAKPGEKGYPKTLDIDEDYYNMDLVEFMDIDLEEGTIQEAEYQGKQVTLNKPFYTPDGPKKSAVYVQKGDKVIIVRFGDPNMEIKKDDPERRKSFRARHNCDTATDKTTPRFWSCKAW